MKSDIGFWLAYLHLTLDHSKGQGHMHFDCKYLINGNIKDNHYYYHPLIDIFTFILAHSTSQCQGYEHIDCEYLGNGDDRANATFAIQ